MKPRTATKIVGLVQVKGGAGRSTIATNLAGELVRFGNVALIDCDMPQGTSASWGALRQQVRPSDNLKLETAATHRELVDKVDRLREWADYVVLDGPPRIAETTRAILVLSDLCLVPIGASAPEVWATSDLLTLLAEARKVRKVDARILWTRFRSYTRLAQELSQEAHKTLHLPALRTTLGYRVAYAEALGQGLTVVELPDPHAREELIDLVAEVKRLVR